MRSASWGGPLAAFAFVASTLTPAAALADVSGIALPIYNLPLAAHGPPPIEPAASMIDDPEKHAHAARPELDLSRVDHSFALIELPPDALVPGSATRPHHAFGYRWQGAESWLRDQGLDARTCYLPMMRLHSKVSVSGATGTVWVYGRCTFR